MVPPSPPHIHTHNHFMAIFPGLPGWAGTRRNLLLDFMLQGKITEADIPIIRLGATPSGLISDPPPSSRPFSFRMPFLSQPSQFLLAWDRHQICSLAYPMTYPVDIIWAVMIVWRIKGKIFRAVPVLCCVLCMTVVHNDMHTREHFLKLSVGFRFKFRFCVFV